MTPAPDMPPFLPYAKQAIDENDIAAIIDVLRGDFLTTGPATIAFEDRLSSVTGAPFAVSCSSGTAALHLAALALDLKPGDKVVVPAITFLATANAVRYTGADVIFADVDARNGLMGPEHLERALERGGDKVKAVFPVHLGGQSPDIAEIRKIACQKGLAVVEDASHAIGGKYSSLDGDIIVGSCVHSDMTTFSFHPVKTITMGEGGAVTTQDPALAKRLQLLLNQGIVRDAGSFVHKDMAFSDGNVEANPWYYEMQDIGFNFRASDIHCALGLSQLSKLETFVARRLTLANHYDALLAQLAPIVQPITRMPNGNPAWHLYVSLINFSQAGITRASLMRKLHDSGIGTQVHYIPVNRQPYYQKLYGDIILPGAERYYERCLSLPLFPEMGDDDVKRVVEILTSVLEK